MLRRVLAASLLLLLSPLAAVAQQATVFGAASLTEAMRDVSAAPPP